jgi:hypothetical protein
LIILGGIMELNKRFIVDENNCKVAVQIDIETFNKIEEVIENYALYKLMNKNDEDPLFNLEDAKLYYQRLDKN